MDVYIGQYRLAQKDTGMIYCYFATYHRWLAFQEGLTYYFAETKQAQYL